MVSRAANERTNRTGLNVLCPQKYDEISSLASLATVAKVSKVSEVLVESMHIHPADKNALFLEGLGKIHFASSDAYVNEELKAARLTDCRLDHSLTHYPNNDST